MVQAISRDDSLRRGRFGEDVPTSWTGRDWQRSAVASTPPGKAAKCRQNSVVAEDFIQRLHQAGRDIPFGLIRSFQSSCFDVLLDLSVPYIFECFLKPTGKLPLLCRGKASDSLLNVSHRTHPLTSYRKTIRCKSTHLFAFCLRLDFPVSDLWRLAPSSRTPFSR